MSPSGWHQLIPTDHCFRGAGRFPIDAYSEFMPSPRFGWHPYALEPPDPQLFSDEDPWGWYVSEYEEANEIQPGLEQIARQVVGRIWHLLRGDSGHAVYKRFLDNNVYWPEELAQRSGSLRHDQGVVLLPLALSRTQDDKGRVRWTLFGASEQGPAKAFWKSFHTAPHMPAPSDQGPNFLCHLLRTVYRETVETADDLLRVGLRVLPQSQPLLGFWSDEPLPEWAAPLKLDEAVPPTGIKYLLTFRPFGQLPVGIRQAYLDGSLHLLPTPASLVFWGVPRFLRLHAQLPLGLQAPLAQMIARHSDPHGLRVPQAGLLQVNHTEPGKHVAHPDLVKNTYKRTHRWDRILRDQDELALLQREDKLLHVLFSSIPDDLGLYDKPMARNVQIWTAEGELLLDGPSATPEQLKQAMHTVEAGTVFGYRFVFPAMRIGKHEVYWHRPLAGYHCPDTDQPKVLGDAPLGYLTAYATGESKPDADHDARMMYRVNQPALEKPEELWPRLQRRPLPVASLPLYHQAGKGPTIARNIRKLFDAFHLRGNRPLPRSMACHLLTPARNESLDHCLDALANPELTSAVQGLIEPEETPLPHRKGAKVPDSFTFARTARRAFEVAYWKTIATLAEGRFLNKNNADCVRDVVTQNMLPYHGRHLDPLAEYLLGYYRKLITGAHLSGKALAGEHRFRWRTDFDYSWMGGWLMNLERPAECNVIAVIPGRDRSQAVIMADHYDTAYMADRYEKDYGGRGARLAACGADDNHSATAALMLAAPIFLEMSKQGHLGCDVWLVHLTGEEFPADCLGARHLTQALVEGNLTLHLSGDEQHDLSGTRVRGVYVSDMIAHNNDRERDVFQISPGTSRASLGLAEQAHLASAVWNASVPVWNRKPERAGKKRSRRSPYGAAIPETAPHLALNGQIRPVTDPHSTLYNTDGQIFSDAGVPVVLFMENYDINRTGYHDTHDTMANIDLDYGAALAAIVIESVARAACQGA
jgi:hypothetical protein